MEKPNYTMYSHTPNGYLDMVLKSILPDRPPIHTALEINESIKKEDKIELGESFIISVLNHLVRDEYCSFEDRNVTFTSEKGTLKQIIRYYTITFERRFS
jgi:hypothetical protein